MRILLVENNVRLTTLLSKGLASRGFSCDCAHSLAEAEVALAGTPYEALVLDLGLPDGDGREWLRGRAETKFALPTLILTARNALTDRVAGLNAGADDYLVKPVELEELTARLRAILRRPGARSPVNLTSGKLSFDVETRTAYHEGSPLDLTRREANLLELLLRREGAVVQRRTIDEALYSCDDAVTPNAVDALVSRLRKKLDTTEAHQRLHTIRGVGYMLAAPKP